MSILAIVFMKLKMDKLHQIKKLKIFLTNFVVERTCADNVITDVIDNRR